MRMIAAVVVLTLTSMAAAAESSPSIEVKVPEAKSAEARLVEAKSEAKLLLPELTKHDLWSELEWEMWAKTVNFPMHGLLSECRVLGSAAFATPDDIQFISDHGNQVEVLTNTRWHCFAEDGHPVAASIPFNRYCDHGCFGFSHTVIAVGSSGGNKAGELLWRIRALTVPGGGEVLAQDGAEEKGADWDNAPIVVADDGSAVAMMFRRAKPRRAWTVLSTAQDRRIQLDKIVDPEGVGSKGAWLIAHAIADNGDYPPVLVAGKDHIILRSAAVGPGIAAAVLADGSVALIDQQGQRQHLNLAIGIGEGPRVVSVGHWLLVDSGRNGKSVDNTDLFGVEMPNPPPQPETIACFRWEDLLANAAAPAVTTVTGGFLPNNNLPAAIYTWKGPQLTQVDLSGKVPQSKLLYTAPSTISWADSGRFQTRVWLGDNVCVVIDDQGHELWSGTGSPNIWYRDAAIVTSGDEHAPEYALVHLSEDAKTRTSMPLDVQGGGWEFRIDPYLRQVIATREEQWILFDYQGHPITESGIRTDYPNLVWLRHARGRFYGHFGRLFAKSGSEGDIADRLAPADAWQVIAKRSPVVIVLERGAGVDVVSESRKGTSYKSIGTCQGATQLALMDKDSEPVFSDGKVMVGHVEDTLIKSDSGATAVQDMPSGPWRLTGDNVTDFSPPRSSGMQWSEPRAGFTPHRLRSPSQPEDDPPLLIVTSSLLIIIRPEAANYFADIQR